MLATNTHIETENHGSYGSKLFDPRWREKRKQIIARDNNKCVICGSPKKLQVHHRQYQFSLMLQRYKEPWEYQEKLLITLCERCHQKGHKIYKVPVKQIR